MEQTIITALSGLIGVGIGSFASYKVMTKQFKIIAKQELQKQNREDKLYLKRKREELYGQLYDFLMMYEKDIRDKNKDFMSQDTKKLWNVIQIGSIFANTKTMELFYKTNGKLLNNLVKYKSPQKSHDANNKIILDFYAHIRKELGVED